MVRWLKRNPFFTLGLGLAMGLLVGVGMLAGALVAVGVQSAQPQAQWQMPQIPLHAASHGSEGFAMATGNINEDVDGLYTLDYLTGDLHCWVFNPRTMDFRGLFSTNVQGDLGFEKGKKPNYAMVTGLVSWVGGTAGPARPANALVYVADCNSGNFAAYGLFINKSASTVGIAQKDALRKVAFGKGRQIAERDK